MEGKKCENGMKGKLWTTKIKQLRRLDRSDKQIDNHRTMMKWLIHDKNQREKRNGWMSMSGIYIEQKVMENECFIILICAVLK